MRSDMSICKLIDILYCFSRECWIQLNDSWDVLDGSFLRFRPSPSLRKRLPPPEQVIQYSYTIQIVEISPFSPFCIPHPDHLPNLIHNCLIWLTSRSSICPICRWSYLLRNCRSRKCSLVLLPYCKVKCEI